MDKDTSEKLFKQLQDQFIKSVDEEAEKQAFKRGFYDASEYTVVLEPVNPHIPQLEEIRIAAQLHWPNKILISIAEIEKWIMDGAVNPLTNKVTIQYSSGSELKRAILLIENGVFRSHLKQS